MSTSSVVNLTSNFIQSLLPTMRTSGSSSTANTPAGVANASGNVQNADQPSPFADVLNSVRTPVQSAGSMGSGSLDGELALMSGTSHHYHHTDSSGSSASSSTSDNFSGPSASSVAGSLNQLFESLTSPAALSANNAFNAQSIVNETLPSTGI
jgi:hypothetical protein